MDEVHEEVFVEMTFTIRTNMFIWGGATSFTMHIGPYLRIGIDANKIDI